MATEQRRHGTSSLASMQLAVSLYAIDVLAYTKAVSPLGCLVTSGTQRCLKPHSYHVISTELEFAS